MVQSHERRTKNWSDKLYVDLLISKVAERTLTTVKRFVLAHSSAGGQHSIQTKATGQGRFCFMIGAKKLFGRKAQSHGEMAWERFFVAPVSTCTT